MAYDYQKALESGATEDQVLNYLNQTRGYKVGDALQNGASKRQVIEYLATTQKPETQNTAPAQPSVSKSFLERGKIDPNSPKQMKIKENSNLGNVANFLGIKKFGEGIGQTLFNMTKEKRDLDKLLSEGKIQPDVYENITTGGLSNKDVIGSAINTGAMFIPGAGAGTSLGRKVLTGAATGYAFDIGSKMQENKPMGDVFTPGVGTAIGAALPVGGAIIKPVTNFTKRLVRGLASGLSGVSTQTIDTIVDNPKTASEVTKIFEKSGNKEIIEKNAKTVIDGISNIRKKARQAYGEAIQALKTEDINPKLFRDNVKSTLDNYGSKVKANGERILENVEFSDPKNLKTASSLINELSKTKLDGYSLNKLINKIENKQYKIATSDERLSFNAFLRDLSSSLKDSINKSTGKLKEINAKYSSDLQLTEAMEDIFGQVNFKNLPELMKASQKLETIFAKKGIVPDVFDNFLNRIGIKPQEFRTSEAVRQISQKETGANAKGLSLGEITQQVTSSILTPQMVNRLSIITGLGKEKLTPLFQEMKPFARNILLRALLQANQTDSEQPPE